MKRISQCCRRMLWMAVGCCLVLVFASPGSAREKKATSSGRQPTISREAGNDAAKPGCKVGYVDYRMLLLQHPLMKRFDPASRRFAGTVSAFAPNLEEHRQACGDALRAVQQRLKTLELDAKPLLRSGGKSARDAYSAYWKKRAFLQDEESMLQSSIASSAVTGNYHLGITTEDSLIPLVALINRQIRDVVEDLKTRHQLDLVLDVAGFASDADRTEVSPIRVENLHWALWEGKPATRDQFLIWKKQAWARVSLSPSDRTPVLAGGIDLRLEAVELLKTWSEPSLKEH